MPDVDPGDVRRKGFLPEVVVPEDFDSIAMEEITDLFDGVEEQVTPADR